MERHKPFSKQLNDYEGKRIFDSRIENIDTAMYKFIDEQMNLHTSNGYLQSVEAWNGLFRAQSSVRVLLI